MIIKFSTPFRFLASCARAAYARLFGYQVTTPIDEWDARMEKCMTCEEITEEEQCSLCTCFVAAKTALALEQCPKKKWLRVWKKRNATF